MLAHVGDLAIFFSFWRELKGQSGHFSGKRSDLCTDDSEFKQLDAKDCIKLKPESR